RVSFLFFFFFQAEDGIRDFHVTGVQTCALPISALFRRIEALQGGNESERLVRGSLSLDRDRMTAHWKDRQVPLTLTEFWVVHARSEERRVGKECRSRWWPCAENKTHRAEDEIVV